MTVTFVSVLEQADGMSATGIPVPDSAIAELGTAKTPAVVATVRRTGDTSAPYVFRITVGTYKGRKMISVSSAHRETSGLAAGDELEVTLELDTAPRVVEVPEDVATALAGAGATDAFAALSYSKQRAHIDPVLAAKADDTRARRVQKIVDALTA